MTTATFEYRARDRQVAVHAGRMEGILRRRGRGVCATRGFVPFRIEQASAPRRSIARSRSPASRKKVKSKDVAILSRQLATMVSPDSP